MRILHALPLITPLLLAACAPPGAITRAPGLAARVIPPLDTWSVAVTGCAQPAACAELQTALTAQLVSRQLANRVVTPGPAPTAMTVEITASSQANTVQLLAGAVEGAERDQATVTVRDTRRLPPLVLRRFTARSEGLVHPFSPEAGLQDSYRQFASDIVDGLRP